MTKTNKLIFLTENPWPITSSVWTNSLFISMILMLQKKIPPLTFFMSVMMTSINALLWWNNIKQENSLMGLYNKVLNSSIKMSFILFIVSEILLFTSFFWAFFHNSISPNIEMGMIWPPKGIEKANPLSLPLMGSIFLLMSGFSITMSHHLMMSKNTKKSSSSTTFLMITISLGLMFLMMQKTEYMDPNFNLTFSMNDSTYSNTFLMITGLHGSHVLVGMLFLTYVLMFKLKKSLSPSSHTSFELSAWYWHFVDIVWLFVYSFLYWWNT